MPKLEIRTYEFSIPSVAPENPRRQTEWGDYQVEMTEATVDFALKKIGGLNPDESGYLVCSEDNRNTAVHLGHRFRLQVVLMPPETMSSSYAWAIVAAKGSIFSCPTT